MRIGAGRNALTPGQSKSAHLVKLASAAIAVEVRGSCRDRLSITGLGITGELALRWTAAGFLEAKKSFRKLRGHAQTLIDGLRPTTQPLKKAA